MSELHIDHALAVLVVKDGVALGGLGPEERAGALALAWCGLPAGRVLAEREVNVLLARQLAAPEGPLQCLATDHVELRRWLVDAGWLARDGFGREYRRVAAPSVPPPWTALATAIDGFDAAPWVADLRRRRAAERAARRAAWERGRADRPAA